MAVLAALPPVTQGPESQYDIFLNGLNDLMNALNGKVATPITIKGQVLNVMGFGAFNDGSNADATTAAVQAAIDALPRGSYGAGTVYFPPGVYSVSSSLKAGRSMAAITISFTAPNLINDSANGFGALNLVAGDVITVQGAAAGPPTNNTVFDVVSVTAGVITVPSGVTTEGAGANIRISRTNTSCRFRGCGWGSRIDWRGGNNQAIIHFQTNFPTTVPLLDGVYDLRLSNSILATGMVGIQNGASDETTNRNNTKISGVQVDGVVTAIQIWSGVDIVIIENCRMLDVTDGIKWGVSTTGQGAMDTITIDECTFAGVSGWAIDGSGGGNYRVLHNFFSNIEKAVRFDLFDSVQITNNEMEITLGTVANRRAIYLGITGLGGNSMSGAVIDANHINLGSAAAANIGIYLDFVKGVHLHGNSFTNCATAIQTTANANSIFIGQQAWGSGVTTKLTYDNASRPVVMDESIGYAIRSPLNQETLIVHATHATFTNPLIYGTVERADSALFWLLDLGNVTGRKFLIRGDGDVWMPTTANFRLGALVSGEPYARVSKPSSLVSQFTHNASISGGLWYPDEGAVGAGARGYGILQFAESSQYGTLRVYLGQVTAATAFTPTLALTVTQAGLYPAGDIFHNNGYGVKGLTNGLAPNVYVTLIYLDSNNDCNLDAYTGRYIVLQKSIKDSLTVYAPTGNAVLTLQSAAANSIPYLSIINDARWWAIGNRGDLSDDFAITDVTAGLHRLRINSTGYVGVDVSGVSGSYANIDLYDEHDDAVVLHQGISQRKVEVLEQLGIMEKMGNQWMMNLQPMMMLLAGGVYQTRQRLDGLVEAQAQRIATLEAEVALLNRRIA